MGCHALAHSLDHEIHAVLYLVVSSDTTLAHRDQRYPPPIPKKWISHFIVKDVMLLEEPTYVVSQSMIIKNVKKGGKYTFLWKNRENAKYLATQQQWIM